MHFLKYGVAPLQILMLPLRASRERERGKEEEETGDYPKNPGKSAYEAQKADSEELMAIFERTYGKIKPRIGGNDTRPKTAASEKPFRLKEIKKLTSYLLVDGYNILFSWESLRDLARENIDGARERLIQILSEYQANSEYRIIAVFDAYKVPGHDTEIFVQDGIHVVFTKTAETADQYIEKTVEDLRRKYRVTVSTSDGVEQIIIRSKDCLLLSAKELEKDIIGARRRMEELLESQKKGSRSFLLDTEAAEAMKDLLHAENEGEKKKSEGEGDK